MIRILLAYACVIGAFASVGWAATVVAGELPLKSSGAVEGGAWVLPENGYVGTYIKVAKAGEVAVTVRAGGAARPHMNVVVADQRAGFDVADELMDYSHKFSLPAGTYFVRVELTNHSANSDSRLTIAKLNIDGASAIKQNSDAVALAAADTYIQNFRKGEVTVAIPAAIAAPGASVHVKLRSHAFYFGGTIHGENSLALLAADPPQGSEGFKFQQFLNTHFNLLVPSNGGKWSYNEQTQDVATMDFVDACMAYAKAHGMRARQHALLWDNKWQQPDWVSKLLDAALNEKDPAAAAEAKKSLRQRISKRIAYYVHDRASQYIELDVLNEPYHQQRFWKVFGAEGLADIFKETAQAAESAGAHTKLYINEYNIFQWSSNGLVKDAPLDPYGNWYRQLFESVRDAGGPVSGVGVQYYAIKGEPGADKGNPHSPARMAQVLNNLSVLGLPISLSEWGVQKQASPEQAADILDDTMRVVFGTDQATTFIVWGFWAGAMWDQAPMGALLDKEWNLTLAGKRYEKVMSEWNTDLTATVDSEGKIRFVGFWGDYDVTLGEKTRSLTLTRGKTQYALPD